jgi:hypothetical protein
LRKKKGKRYGLTMVKQEALLLAVKIMRRVSALCYKADESADESKKWALVERKSEIKIG